jgi:ankyrin repeat protein
VRVLVEGGAEVNAQALDDNLNTPLHYAAHEGRVAVASYLLQHGADARLRNRSGLTALMCACSSGHAGVADLLLHRTEGGATVDMTEPKRSYTALHFAALEGHAEVRLAELVARSTLPPPPP